MPEATRAKLQEAIKVIEEWSGVTMMCVGSPCVLDPTGVAYGWIGFRDQQDHGVYFVLSAKGVIREADTFSSTVKHV